MKDYTPDAELLFRDFARRHSLAIEKLDGFPIELLMRVRPQSGLSFELTLGLQNADEINLGFEGFWSYFFPFEKERHIVSDVLDAIMTGDCRLEVHTQLGRVVKRVLQRRSEEKWRRIYTELARVPMPFLDRKISHVYNTAAMRRA